MFSDICFVIVDFVSVFILYCECMIVWDVPWYVFFLLIKRTLFFPERDCSKVL